MSIEKIKSFYNDFTERLEKEDRNFNYEGLVEEKGNFIDALKSIKEDLGIAIFEDGNLGLDDFFYEVKNFLEKNEFYF
ncbi:MAG: hypothetical protein SOZ95_06655 [Bacilli bacterium]|nr:hypothetical protein [Bacilli bacterium]